MPKLLLGLIGTAGSGKSSVSAYLEKRYGAVRFRFSDYLAKILSLLGLERSRDNLVKISVALRREFGEDALAHAISQDAMNAKTDIVIVDGIRRAGDVSVLEALPHFVLIGIDAPAKVRYERNKRRIEKAGDATMTWEHFLELEQAPTEVTIPDVMKRARHRIDNTGSVEDLEKQVDEIMNQLQVDR